VKTADALIGLEKLIPGVRESGDRVFIVRCECGAKIGWTKLSRKTAGYDLGTNLEGMMAHQLGIRTDLWRLIAGCQRERPDYLAAHRGDHNCPGAAKAKPAGPSRPKK
jgi:hypothetical protein